MRALGKGAAAGHKLSAAQPRPWTETPALSQDDIPANNPGHACAPAPRKGAKLWVPAVLAAAIVLGLWGPNLLRPPPPAWTTYVSTKGQIKRVVLADKSVLRLNGASSARVVFEDDDRRAALGEAEAAFLITGSNRPFLITAGDREVRMEGGELNILRQTGPAGAVTTLTVRHGQAAVYPLGQPQQAVQIGPRRQLAWTDGQPLSTPRVVNANNAFAWESHQLAYDKAPLSEVIADLNRYVARPIRLGDPKLATMIFTGMLTLEGEAGLLRKLEMELPIQDQPLAAEIVLRRLPPCGFKNCDRPARKKKPNPLVQSLLKLEKPAAPILPAAHSELLPVAPPPAKPPTPAAKP